MTIKPGWKKFPVYAKKGNSLLLEYLGISSPNIHTIYKGEKPYRITIFELDLSDNWHIDLSPEELEVCHNLETFPGYILKNLNNKYNVDFRDIYFIIHQKAT